MLHCDHCGGPVTTGHAGRPWPGRPAATYCCFGCLSLGEQRRQEAAAPAGGRTFGVGVRLGIGLLVVGQSMIFGLALNLHDDVPPAARAVAESLLLAATLVVVALLGPPLVRAAWGELRRGRLTIEALFLLTLGGAMAASLQAFVTGRGKVYFEVVSLLLVVYTLGKLVGARSRAAALAGARAWAGQLATCRLVDEKGRTRVVPVTEVLPGDVVEVNPGETVAVDGVIRTGVGFVSEAAVTGEPFPAVRRPGDRVSAGAASHDATLRVEATAAGTERQVDRLLAAVEAARDRPVSLQARADALGRWLLPLVVLAAGGTFGYWTFLTPDGWEVGLFHAMSVLLVACPCVIGLATPIVIWSALGRLAERGVVVRAGDAVERLAEVDRVLFDKTGTLTDDRFALLDVATAATGDERAKLLGWVSAVQGRSRHPAARPFAALPRPFGEPRVLDVKAVPGCGVDADIEADGARHRLQIGTPEWVAQCSGGTGIPAGGLAPQLRATGHRVDVALDGELVAAAVLAERLRDSAPRALAEFRRLGLPVEVLTGDAAERAAALGLPAPRGGLSADDKRAAVAAGRALFVGDGINDAAALASAHVGVALASGTDLAVAAADVTLYHADLRVLPWAVELSRRAVRAVRRNLCRALCYNLVGMALAACGLLHPVAAVLLMVLSSLSLVYSSARVGVVPDHCSEPSGGREPPVGEFTQGAHAPRSGSRPTTRAAAHGLALALQGVALLLLVPAAGAGVVAGFAAAGVALGYVWCRWAVIPHALDMCVGMLTLGNLGMLLGWWADGGFAPPAGHACCGCRDGGPWMWVGMLASANAAMLWLPRRPLPPGDHARAMFTGGNVGMAAGMVAGGWCAAQLVTESITAAFAAMTVGMLAGMLLGTWLAERALGLARSLPLPRRPAYRTK
jgi:heavy metal translocating P-type ATPase